MDFPLPPFHEYSVIRFDAIAKENILEQKKNTIIIIILLLNIVRVYEKNLHRKKKEKRKMRTTWVAKMKSHIFVAIIIIIILGFFCCCVFWNRKWMGKGNFWREKIKNSTYFCLSDLYEAVSSSNNLLFISINVFKTLYTRATIVWFQCSLLMRYRAGNIIGMITWLFSSIKLIMYSLFQKYKALSATFNDKKRKSGHDI